MKSVNPLSTTKINFQFDKIMANEEHMKLSQYLKEVHSDLRKSTLELGAKKAWKKHCEDKNKLKTYSQYMEKLATTHWQVNFSNSNNEVICRINWVADFCHDYFINGTAKKYHDRDIEIGKKIDILINCEEFFQVPVKLIDVGSCYNPFKMYPFFDVLAIDLYPANEFVMQCDFLNVPLGKETHIKNSIVTQLQENAYDVVSFCFLLEYIPTSELRIVACETAYKLLKPGGLLVITTPDSKHVGANSKIMKCWRYALALMGFSRIKYEKFKHMHCLALRKSLHKEIAIRWSHIYKEPFMDYAIHIPQDFNSLDIQNNQENKKAIINCDANDFIEMPFSDSLDTSKI